jgi:hypothetical protein
MNHTQTGYRENPCPDESVSPVDRVHDALLAHDEATVSAFIDYCDDRIDDFLEHEATRRRNEAEEIKREAA